MKYQLIMMSGLLLNACVSGLTSGDGVSVGVGIGGMFGNRIGVETSIQMPAQTTPTTIHFDAQGRLSDAASKNGFYRQIISKQSANQYIVQDFYEMGGAKRTDPMPLTASQLYVFRATPANGALTVYSINGAILQQQTFQNNQFIK